MVLLGFMGPALGDSFLPEQRRGPAAPGSYIFLSPEQNFVHTLQPSITQGRKLTPPGRHQAVRCANLTLICCFRVCFSHKRQHAARVSRRENVEVLPYPAKIRLELLEGGSEQTFHTAHHLSFNVQHPPISCSYTILYIHNFSSPGNKTETNPGGYRHARSANAYPTC